MCCDRGWRLQLEIEKCCRGSICQTHRIFIENRRRVRSSLNNDADRTRMEARNVPDDLYTISYPEARHRKPRESFYNIEASVKRNHRFLCPLFDGEGIQWHGKTTTTPAKLRSCAGFQKFVTVHNYLFQESRNVPRLSRTQNFQTSAVITEVSFFFRAGSGGI